MTIAHLGGIPHTPAPFGSAALALWDVGLTPIPIKRDKTRKPLLLTWKPYQQVQPSRKVVEGWARIRRLANVAIITGINGGLVWLDIDSPDPSVIARIEAITGVTPLRRIGSKGYAGAFQFNGEVNAGYGPPNKPPLCELLSTGRVITVPPSVHYATQLPYTYAGEVTLLDLPRLKLPRLPENIDKLLAAELGGRKHPCAGSFNPFDVYDSVAYGDSEPPHFFLGDE